VTGPGLSSGMRWSGISVLGREATRTVFTIVLARIIGPEDFGIVAQALVYIGIISLLVDQGFSSALIQRKEVGPAMPGAVVTVNLTVGAALAAATVLVAPLWASFMHTPELVLVLIAFAPSLLFRAASVTPRAMLIRAMDFRKIAVADISSALVGGVLGLIAALTGAGYWALVVQILTTDIVLVVVFVVLGTTWRPNLKLRQLKEIAGFAGRTFAAGILLNSVSRNIDNLLVGRFQGAEALAFYGLAYRLLLIPVQLGLTTVATVLFSAFSRLTDDRSALRTEVARATRAIAILALPVMALIAASAPQLVAVVFGPQWQPAVPIVCVLAMAGALQAIYQSTTTPAMLSLGRDKLSLRYAWLTTLVTTVGIVAGLPHGPFGVAVGYTAATVLLVPVEWAIRAHLVGMTIRTEIATVGPAAHVAAWVAGSYLAVAALLPQRDLVALAAGVVVAAVAGIAVLRIAHRRFLGEIVDMGRRLAGRGADTTESDRQQSDDKPS
jgi:O-antigen/teichoic acid export membrane protein